MSFIIVTLEMSSPPARRLSVQPRLWNQCALASLHAELKEIICLVLALPQVDIYHTLLPLLYPAIAFCCSKDKVNIRKTL